MTILLSILSLIATTIPTHVPKGGEVFVRTLANMPIERLAAAVHPYGRLESRKRGSSTFLVELKPGLDNDEAREKLSRIPGVTPLDEREEQRERLVSRRPRMSQDSDGKLDLDSPDKAAEWRRLAMLDEHKTIEPHALARAIQQKQKLRKATHPFIQGDSWQELGPSDFSGRSTVVIVDPKNPTRIWMGTAGGGIWRSMDGGQSWTAIGDQLPSLAIGSMALDPNDQTTLYAGTGEGTYNIDEIAGEGIFKSTDGGNSWTQLPGTSSWLWSHINRIAIAPGNPNLILATRLTGGIFRSADGGNTFTQVLNSWSAHAVAFSPKNPKRVIGTIQDFNSSGGRYEAAVYSVDGGLTWTKSTGPLNNFANFGRIETYPLVNDEMTVYASASDGNVYKSTDGGASYVLVTTNGNSGANWYANAIWVDPTNSNRLVIGGTYVYSSTDGGVTLNRIGAGYIQTDQPHPDIHFFAAQPGYDGVTNKGFYVSTDGGLYTTSDITTASTSSGWSRLDQGARSTQFYSVAGDASSGRVVGGLQDNGTQSMLGNSQASYIFGGDGGYVAIDQANPTYIYGEYIYLEIFRNNDGGSGGNSGWIDSGLPDAGTNANFIAPFILDPNNSQTLLAGGSSLWRSVNPRDATPTWSAIRAPGTSLISAIAVAPGSSDIIWVGQNDGGIAMTTNGTSASPTWTTISTSAGTGPLPARYVTRILVDPSNSSLVYVTFGGFSSNNVWKTTDGGSTWTPITGTGVAMLPQVPVRAIARRPGSPNTLYVGTEIGLFSTFDGGKTWTTSSDMDINASVDDLEYMNHSNTLLAGTHGRGIWMLTYVTATVQTVTLNPNPVVGGATTTGTVSLLTPAPAGGITVTLASNSSTASVPGSVFIPANTISATFPVTTSSVSGSTSVKISATRDTTTATGALTVVPPSLTGVSIAPTSIVGGTSAVGTVTLNGPAPIGGISVGLISGNKDVSVPTTVVVPASSSSATFVVSSKGVAGAESVKVTATYGTVSSTASLTLNPASLSAVSVSPTSIVGGNNAVGTVSLNGMAAGSGISVTLSSGSTNASVPPSVTVPAGSSSVTFKVTTKAVASAISVGLTAKQGSISESTSLTLEPNNLQSVAVSPTTVVGGSSTVVTGTVTMTGSAPTGGETVSLSSSNTKLATLLATVKVPSGSSTANFVVTTLAASEAGTVTIQASYAGVAQGASLTVTPYQVASVTVTPSSILGGKPAVGTVTITAPAGKSGVIVALSSNVSSVGVAGTVTIASGKTSATFAITTKAVSSTVVGTVTGSVGSSSKQATLTVNSVTIASLSLSPSSVKGRSTASVTGTVTLNAAAPAGGITVTLSSSNTTVASAPVSVSIAAGKTSGTFKVTHTGVTSQTSVTISATATGTTKTATLTVTP